MLYSASFSSTTSSVWLLLLSDKIRTPEDTRGLPGILWDRTIFLLRLHVYIWWCRLSGSSLRPTDRGLQLEIVDANNSFLFCVRAHVRNSSQIVFLLSIKITRPYRIPSRISLTNGPDLAGHTIFRIAHESSPRRAYLSDNNNNNNKINNNSLLRRKIKPARSVTAKQWTVSQIPASDNARNRTKLIYIITYVRVRTESPKKKRLRTRISSPASCSRRALIESREIRIVQLYVRQKRLRRVTH